MKMKLALRATAYHEAGHAVADWRHGFKIKRVTIVPAVNSKGMVSGKDFRFRDLEYGRLTGNRIGYYHDRIICCLAGGEAQRRFNPRSFRTHHTASDIESVKELLFRLHSDQEKEAFHAMKYLQARARNFVRFSMNRQMIEDLAKALLERRSMTGEEVAETLRASMQAQRECARRVP